LNYMKTLLELRDIEQERLVANTNQERPMFLAIDAANRHIFNGWFLDPFLNTIEIKDIEGKAVHFSDVEMSKIQADFV